MKNATMIANLTFITSFIVPTIGGTHALEIVQHSVKNRPSCLPDILQAIRQVPFQEIGDMKPFGNGQTVVTSQVIKMSLTEVKLV